MNNAEDVAKSDEELIEIVKQLKKEEAISAVVNKITPYGIFVSLSESNLEAKLTIDNDLAEKVNAGTITFGCFIDRH